jgi:hypothetical protein
MAERITRRTLLGFREKDSNGNVIQLHVKQDKLITRVGKDKEALITDLRSNGYWNNNKMRNKEITFNAVVGNPPYQMTVGKKDTENGQKAVINIFHHFQMISDGVAKYTSLIYPGGRWIHRSGKGLESFGKNQINDKHLKLLYFFPDANEIFAEAGIADGISIVMKDMYQESSQFKYVYSNKSNTIEVKLSHPGTELIPLNPYDASILDCIKETIKKKEFGYLHDSVLSRCLFSIESDFVEKNPSKVREYKEGDIFDNRNEIKLFTNDKAGKAGRAKWYVANRDVITSGIEYLNDWKVIVSSANAGGQKRSNQIAIVDNYSAFGRSRVALKTFKTEKEAQNFYKYCRTDFIRFAFLMTDEALTSLAKQVPDILDYTDNNEYINFEGDVNSQLYSLFKIEPPQQKHIERIVEAKGY